MKIYKHSSITGYLCFGGKDKPPFTRYSERIIEERLPHWDKVEDFNGVPEPTRCLLVHCIDKCSECIVEERNFDVTYLKHLLDYYLEGKDK